jgi:hypothetical protein
MVTATYNLSWGLPMPNLSSFMKAAVLAALTLLLAGPAARASTLSVSIDIATPAPLIAGELITFDGIVSGGSSPYTFSWFGPDGAAGATQDITLTFPAAGTYIVSLDVIDTLTDAGSDAVRVSISPASAATPLPAALPLFATGIGAMGLLGWRRKRKAQVVA